MNTKGSIEFRLKRAGGLAALYLAAAYLLAMPYFLMVVDYLGAPDVAARVNLVVANEGSMRAMHLVSYVVFGAVLVVLAVALHERLSAAAPGMARVATALGLLWAGMLVASGMVFISGMGAVVAAYPSDPTGAVATWRVIESVTEGLSSADGEFLGGAWVLLVSIAGLRAGLSRPLAWLGIVTGVAGVVSLVPPLNDARMAFGLLQIPWFIWLGTSMLRSTGQPARAASLETRPIGTAMPA